jgi:hypothetical protein
MKIKYKKGKKSPCLDKHLIRFFFSFYERSDAEAGGKVNTSSTTGLPNKNGKK